MAEQPKDQFDRTADFVSRYANNTQYELHSTDLRITFGEVEVNRPVQQHTAITTTWVQAKLMIYFLQANLRIIETLFGKVIVPNDLLPAAPTAPTAEQIAADPRAQSLFETMKEFREAFIASNKA